MKYSFYLHDLFYEVGHSNVTIDMINNFPEGDKDTYHFIVFTADKPEVIFPNLSDNVTYHYVTFPNIRIAFIKIIFYQLYSLFYSLFIDTANKKISLGVANLNCDISIIHFLHHQWHEKYFPLLAPSGFKNIYKKIFFYYLDLCEKILFKVKKPQVITVSHFMENYIKNKFFYSDNSVKTIHSGFDIQRFYSSKLSKQEIIKKLSSLHPQIEKIDFEAPLCLFVGAFERKGLNSVLKEWKSQIPNGNLLVIGKSETGTNSRFEELPNVFYISFTSEMNLFYELCDYFFFPTHYEPFGMVLIEAAIKGLKIYTTKENVGAAEVLESLTEIRFSQSPDEFSVPKNLKKLSEEERKTLVKLRSEALSHLNWNKISQVYSDFFK